MYCLLISSFERSISKAFSIESHSKSTPLIKLQLTVTARRLIGCGVYPRPLRIKKRCGNFTCTVAPTGNSLSNSLLYSVLKNCATSSLLISKRRASMLTQFVKTNWLAIARPAHVGARCRRTRATNTVSVRLIDVLITLWTFRRLNFILSLFSGADFFLIDYPFVGPKVSTTDKTIFFVAGCRATTADFFSRRGCLGYFGGSNDFDIRSLCFRCLG